MFCLRFSNLKFVLSQVIRFCDDVLYRGLDRVAQRGVEFETLRADSLLIESRF
jgi:hypothetical protein